MSEDQLRAWMEANRLNWDDRTAVHAVVNLGEPMTGINIDTLIEEEKMAGRGW